MDLKAGGSAMEKSLQTEDETRESTARSAHGKTAIKQQNFFVSKGINNGSPRKIKDKSDTKVRKIVSSTGEIDEEDASDSSSYSEDQGDENFKSLATIVSGDQNSHNLPKESSHTNPDSIIPERSKKHTHQLSIFEEPLDTEENEMTTKQNKSTVQQSPKYTESSIPAIGVGSGIGDKLSGFEDSPRKGPDDDITPVSGIEYLNEEQKNEDNFTDNVNFNDDDDRSRSDSIRSGYDSKNTSQVFNVLNYENIMGDSSPLRPYRKSRFRPLHDSEMPSPKIDLNAILPSTELRKSDSTHSQTERKRISSFHKNWNRVSLVVKSVMYMQNHDVRSIGTIDEMFDDMSQYTLKKVRNLKGAGMKEDLAKDDFVQEALDQIRRTEVLCDCSTIGSDKHLKLMIKLLKEDPRGQMLSRSDPTHIINKHCGLGQNSIYLACKHGNIDIVKFLLQQQADPQIESSIDRKGKVKEKCLQVAVRWGCTDVVRYLLDNVEFTKKDLKTALNQCESRPIKNMLVEAFQKKYGSLGCLFSLFSP